MLRSRVILVVPLLVLMTLSVAGPERTGIRNDAASLSQRIEFKIKGDVAGLYPGHTQKATITLRNRYRSPIEVRRVVVRTQQTGRAGCAPSSVFSPGWRGHRLVRPSSTATVKVRFTMRASAPAACQGAKYTFRYTGWGSLR